MPPVDGVLNYMKENNIDFLKLISNINWTNLPSVLGDPNTIDVYILALEMLRNWERALERT